MIATGIYSTFQAGKSVRPSLPCPAAPLTSLLQKSGGAVALRTPYLRVLGLEIDTDGRGRGTRNFTAEEEEEFGEMARGEGFYERFSKSIAPSIFGSDGAFFLLFWVLRESSRRQTQISRRPSLASSLADRRRFSPTACACEETSMSFFSETPERPSPSSSSLSRRSLPSQSTPPARDLRQQD